MSERNYLKTEAVFLAEKTPKKEVVVTPPLREDSLTVTENGTYQAPIGRGYTDVEVNVAGAEPLIVTLTKNPNDEYYTADKTNTDILTAIANKTPVYLIEGGVILLLNMANIINPSTQESRFRASIPNVGSFETYDDSYNNTTWQIVEDKTIFWVNLEWDNDLDYYVADKTNGEILAAINNGLVPYLAFNLHDYPNYANFSFTSPILLAGYDDTNNLTLFQSMMYTSDIMFTLYSTTILPVSTNTYWTLSIRNLASTVYVEEATYYPVYLSQEAGNASDTFTSSEGVSGIINNFGVRIPFIYINYNDDTREIRTRNLEVCNDGTLHIIYYDPEKSALCKLTHNPTDDPIEWTRSTL